MDDSILHADDMAAFGVADAFLRSRHPDVQMFWRQLVHAGWSRYHFEDLVARDDVAGFWASLGGRAAVLLKAVESFGEVCRLLEPLHAANLVPFPDLEAYVQSIEDEMHAFYRASLPFGTEEGRVAADEVRLLAIDVVNRTLGRWDASGDEHPPHLSDAAVFAASDPQVARAVADRADRASFSQTAEAYLWLLSDMEASERRDNRA